MKTFCSTYWYFSFAISISLLAPFITNAQCDPPPFENTDCFNAPEICLQDACFMTTNNLYSGHVGFCGINTIVNNPQYFIITAISTTIQMNIHVETPCLGGNSALQSAIVQIPDLSEPIDSCNMWSTGDVLTCDPGTPPGGTMVLIFNNAVIGEQYLLLVDGLNGAQCQYTIDFADGIYEPQIIDSLTMIYPINDTVCLGQDEIIVEVGPDIQNAYGYIWETDCLEPPVQTTTLPELRTEIPDDAPTGPCRICARAFSGCDTSEVEICMTIELYEVQDKIADPITLCKDDLPYHWHDMTIDSPGIYTSQFFTFRGCPFDSILSVDFYPETPTGILDTIVCDTPLVLGNMVLDSSGIFTVTLDDESILGCDSMLVVHLTLLDTSIMEYINYEGCEGDGYLVVVNGINYGETNPTGVEALTASNGCDSTIIIDLTFHPPVVTVFTDFICQYNTPLPPGIYSESEVLKAASGCDSIVTFETVVSGIVEVQDSLQICKGDSALIGDQWVSFPGTYQDSALHEEKNTCDSVFHVLVEYKSLPTGITIAGRTLISEADDAEYQWMYCDPEQKIIEGATGKTFNPNITGSYAVIINVDGCIDTSDCVFIFVIPRPPYERPTEVEVFPNPGDMRTTMYFNRDIEPLRVILIDLSGKVIVPDWKRNNRSIILDLSELASGLYHIVLETADAHWMEKLIVY